MKLNKIYFALLSAIIGGASEKERNGRLVDFIHVLEAFLANEINVFATDKVLQQIKINPNLKKRV